MLETTTITSDNFFEYRFSSSGVQRLKRVLKASLRFWNSGQSQFGETVGLSLATIIRYTSSKSTLKRPSPEVLTKLCPYVPLVYRIEESGVVFLRETYYRRWQTLALIATEQWEQIEQSPIAQMLQVALERRQQTPVFFLKNTGYGKGDAARFNNILYGEILPTSDDYPEIAIGLSQLLEANITAEVVAIIASKKIDWLSAINQNQKPEPDLTKTQLEQDLHLQLM